MANISRIDPFSGIDPFEDMFKGFFRPVSAERNPQPRLKIDVSENEKSYTVHAEIPGVDKENIHVTIDGNHVSISAEVRRQKEVNEGETTLRSERYFGKVSRSFVLESEIEEAGAEAQYKDGVLELVLPKKAATAAKRLTIN